MRKAAGGGGRSGDGDWDRLHFRGNIDGSGVNRGKRDPR